MSRSGGPGASTAEGVRSMRIVCLCAIFSGGRSTWRAGRTHSRSPLGRQTPFNGLRFPVGPATMKGGHAQLQ